MGAFLWSIMFTASKTNLVLACQAWEHLPKMRETTGEAAEKGNRVHDRIERHMLGLPSGPSRDTPEESAQEEEQLFQCGKREVEQLRAEGWKLRPEVTVGWDPVHGKTWGPEVLMTARDYPKMEGYIFGTIDVLGERDGDLLILDWKTGMGKTAWEQVYTLAATFYEAAGELGPSGRIFTSVVYLSDGKTVASEFTAEDYVVHKGRVRSALDGLSRRSKPIPGPHCCEAYCPALLSCPTVDSYFQRIAREGDEKRLLDLAQDSYATDVVLAQAAAKKANEILGGVKERGLPVYVGDKVYSNASGRWIWTKRK
jgi:PD-(D/E)XK nuclease superfamily